MSIAAMMANSERYRDGQPHDLGATPEQERAEWLAYACVRMELPARTVAILEDGPKRTDAMEAIRGPFELLCLAGPVGVGKSMAGAAWLWEMASRPNEASASGLFVSGGRLARWNRYDEVQMKRLLSVRRLVLDDLGNEFADEKGSYLSTLNEVVITRYDNRRPTLITTNLTADGFRKRYGDRIADRINERKGFVGLGGQSMRSQ